MRRDAPIHDGRIARAWIGIDAERAPPADQRRDAAENRRDDAERPRQEARIQAHFLRILRIFAIHAAELYLPFEPLRDLVAAATTRFFFEPERRRFGAALEPPRRARVPPFEVRPAREKADWVAVVCEPIPEIPARPRRGICGMSLHLHGLARFDEATSSFTPELVACQFREWNLPVRT